MHCPLFSFFCGKIAHVYKMKFVKNGENAHCERKVGL